MQLHSSDIETVNSGLSLLNDIVIKGISKQERWRAYKNTDTLIYIFSHVICQHKHMRPCFVSCLTALHLFMWLIIYTCIVFTVIYYYFEALRHWSSSKEHKHFCGCLVFVCSWHAFCFSCGSLMIIVGSLVCFVLSASSSCFLSDNYSCHLSIFLLIYLFICGLACCVLLCNLVQAVFIFLN